MTVALVVHDLSINAAGRAHSLALVLEQLGHTARAYSTVGEQVWNPLRGTVFGDTAMIADEAELAESIASETELIISVKALPGSLGVAHRLARRLGLPLLADVDDPDVEVETVWLRPHRLGANVRDRPGEVAELLGLRRLARQLPTMVSNPVLQKIYGGLLVPHARPDRGAGQEHVTAAPTVAFIGTPRGHKGIPVLREAVSALQEEGWRLLVTAPEPEDPQVWESWSPGPHGDTWDMLCGIDVVAIPSMRYSYGRGQLPMKLIDAMLAARPVVVSDVGPMAWGAGPHGTLVRPGDARALSAALRPLSDPARRRSTGADLRAEALSRYTPEALAPAVDAAIASAWAYQRMR